ncbi:MAG TPA: DUF1398 domain-containing protein [Hyphomicrobiales bacterium]|nr:DUF1398 domain-containing protein [Hyphomicrobiales bacterium]
MNLTIVEELHALNFSVAEKPFPEIAMQLGAAGVQSYRADLVRLEETYYGRDGTTRVAPMPLGDPPAIAADFSTDAVIMALRAIQRQEIRYPEFLRRIMRAGTACYAVFLGGRKAVYTGLDGSTYVENFPAALQIPQPRAA